MSYASDPVRHRASRTDRRGGDLRARSRPSIEGPASISSTTRTERPSSSPSPVTCPAPGLCQEGVRDRRGL